MFVGEKGGGRDNADGQCALGFGSVFAHRADIGGVCVYVIFIVFTDIKHIVREFLLGDNGLLLAVDDEISAVVIFTLAHIETGFRFKTVENTVIGLNHNREPAEENSLESGGGDIISRTAFASAAAFAFAAVASAAASASAAVCDFKYDIDVIMNCCPICHIAQPRLIGEHIMLAVVVINNRFSEIDLIAVFST